MHPERRLHALGGQRDGRQAPRRQRVPGSEAAQDVVDVVVELLVNESQHVRINPPSQSSSLAASSATCFLIVFI